MVIIKLIQIKKYEKKEESETDKKMEKKTYRDNLSRTNMLKKYERKTVFIQCICIYKIN